MTDKPFIFDTHADTFERVLSKGLKFDNDSKLMVSLEKARAGGLSAQTFSSWVHPKFIVKRMALAQCLAIVSKVREAADGRLTLCNTPDEIEDRFHAGKFSGIISVEGCHALEGMLEPLRPLYDLGVRMVGLTWNNRNQFADSCAQKPRYNGLSKRGIELVRRLNRMGFMVDVSHSHDKTIYKTLEVSRAPILASHSNCKTLCNHRRNLTDDLIKRIARKGGVVCVNFYSRFVVTKGDGTIDDLVRHILHIVKSGGENAAGIGADFDGADTFPKGAEDSRCFPGLISKLRAAGLPDRAIRKIMGLNVLRLFKEVHRRKEL